MMYFIRVLLSVINVQELLPIITVFLTALREAVLDFFLFLFFLRDCLFSVLAFESAATNKPTDTWHKIKHPVNTVHSGTTPVSAGLHVVFKKKNIYI